MARSQIMYKFVNPNFSDLWPFSHKMDPDLKIILVDSDVPVTTNWETQGGGFLIIAPSGWSSICPKIAKFNQKYPYANDF